MPRSTVEIVNSLSKGDIENFLLLRRVLWEDYHTLFFDEPIPSIYCMEDSRAYPGLLDNQQMSRLVHLRLIQFGTAPFESYFPEGGSLKNLGFGDKYIQISSATPGRDIETWELRPDKRRKKYTRLVSRRALRNDVLKL